MDLQPTLQNDLVLLRPVKKKDHEPLYQVANDPLIWEQHRFKRYLRNEFNKFFEQILESKGGLVIVDQTNGQVIGSTGFKTINGFPNGLEIGGTFIARNYWGSPVNRTVKKMMIEHALQSTDYIVFHVHKSNLRSQKAMEKLNGLKITGTEFLQIPHKSEDHLRFLVCINCGPDSI